MKIILSSLVFSSIVSAIVYPSSINTPQVSPTLTDVPSPTPEVADVEEDKTQGVEDVPECIKKCSADPLCLSYFAGKTADGDPVCRLDVIPYALSLSKDPYLAYAVPLVGFVGNIDGTAPNRTMSAFWFGAKVDQAENLVLPQQQEEASNPTLRSCRAACVDNYTCRGFEYIRFAAGRGTCRLFSQGFDFQIPAVTNIRFSTKPDSAPPAFVDSLQSIPSGETGNVKSLGRTECYKDLKFNILPEYARKLRRLKVFTNEESTWMPNALGFARDVISQYNSCLRANANKIN